MTLEISNDIARDRTPMISYLFDSLRTSLRYLALGSALQRSINALAICGNDGCGEDKDKNKFAVSRTKPKIKPPFMMLLEPTLVALLFSPHFATPIIKVDGKAKRLTAKYPQHSALNSAAMLSKRAPKPLHYKKNKRNVLKAG
jgi:hypothetical protein